MSVNSHARASPKSPSAVPSTLVSLASTPGAETVSACLRSPSRRHCSRGNAMDYRHIQTGMADVASRPVLVPVMHHEIEPIIVPRAAPNHRCSSAVQSKAQIDRPAGAGLAAQIPMVIPGPRRCSKSLPPGFWFCHLPHHCLPSAEDGVRRDGGCLRTASPRFAIRLVVVS